jgi:hypothetical protein
MHLGRGSSCPDAMLSANTLLGSPKCANPRLRIRRRHALEKPTHRSTTKRRVRCLRRASEESIQSEELFARYACTNLVCESGLGEVRCNSQLRLIEHRSRRFLQKEMSRTVEHALARWPFARIMPEHIEQPISAAGQIIGERHDART